jgi:hypothetical protein
MSNSMLKLGTPERKVDKKLFFTEKCFDPHPNYF